MELRRVETFRVVAEELSFSRAAAKLGYVQSSVSTQVAALERELGIPLFDRMGRKIALTEAGMVMLRYSGRMLDLAEEARESVMRTGKGSSGEILGSLVISAPETLLTYRLPALLALFHERHPGVRMSLIPSAIGRLVGGMRRNVEEGVVDVAFVLDEKVEASGLLVETLLEEEVTVIAPPNHSLASSGSVSPRDLFGEVLLLPEAPESGCAYRGQFERQLGGVGVVPPEKMEFQSIEAVKQCVAAGMGISVLPRVAVNTELDSGRLAALQWDQDFEVFTRMVWHRERWKSPALEAFLESARDIFSDVSVTNS